MGHGEVLPVPPLHQKALVGPFRFFCTAALRLPHVSAYITGRT